MTADDWYDEWLTRLLKSSDRRARVSREKLLRPGDVNLIAARDYDRETEHKRRFIAGLERAS